MKGLPENPDGPMGVWYKRVNALVAQARACQRLDELTELLGEPDEIHVGDDVRRPSDVFAELGSMFRFDDEHAEVVIAYRDPYRPRVYYCFGLEAGRITSHWRDTRAQAT